MGKVIMSGVSKGMTVPVDLLSLLSATLNDNSWELIRAASDAGLASSVWSVGDCKEIVLNGTVGALTLSNYTVCVYIIGFDHNAELEGYNRIHFQLGKTALTGGETVALCDSKFGSTGGTGYFSMYMDTTQTDGYGWEQSQMRNTICGTSLENYDGTIIAVIPDDLRSVLKSVIKYTDNARTGSDSDSTTPTEDYFFLLARGEIIEATDRYYENNYVKQYAYYAAGNTTKRYKHNATTTASTWFTRSPISGDYLFYCVKTDGSIGNYTQSRSEGFAPAFCV